MLPCQFLEHVAKLIDDAPIMPEVPIFLMLVNYKLIVITRNQIKRNMTYIHRFDRDQRKNGLSTSAWSTVFGRLLKEHNNGSFKEKYNGRKELPGPPPVTAKTAQREDLPSDRGEE